MHKLSIFVNICTVWTSVGIASHLIRDSALNPSLHRVNIKKGIPHFINSFLRHQTRQIPKGGTKKLKLEEERNQ